MIAKPSGKKLPHLPSWIHEQLKDLAGLLKSDPAKIKSGFRPTQAPTHLPSN